MYKSNHCISFTFYCISYMSLAYDTGFIGSKRTNYISFDLLSFSLKSKKHKQICTYSFFTILRS